MPGLDGGTSLWLRGAERAQALEKGELKGAEVAGGDQLEKERGVSLVPIHVRSTESPDRLELDAGTDSQHVPSLLLAHSVPTGTDPVQQHP